MATCRHPIIPKFNGQTEASWPDRRAAYVGDLPSRLGENRIRISLEVWPGMFHLWHLFAGLLPQADQALRNAVKFLDDARLLTRGTATPPSG